MRSFLIVSLLLATCITTALYTEKDDVIELGADNFESLVLKSDDLWLVEFYAPWCGHCKQLVPEYMKLATALKGIAMVGAVDMTVHASVGEPYGVTGFPTIKMFGADKKSATDYAGDRTAKALAAFALKELKEVVRKRLGISGGSKDKTEKKAKKKSDVIDATAATFQEVVYGSEDLVLVEFFAPWCGHCKNLAPEWKKAAAQLKGKGATLVAVDATVETELAKKFGVTGYPTIKVFAKGRKDDKDEPKDYNGGRDAAGIVSFCMEELEGPSEPAPTAVITLTSANFDEEVLNSKDLWIVDFYAPWCGHCKSLAPEWAKASLDLVGKVKLGMVDCIAEPALQEKYGVNGFPTLKVFGTDKSEPAEYQGGRVKDAIVSHATELLAEMTAEPKPIVQITSQQVFDAECGSKLCLVLFVPHILDTGASGRETYLDILRAQAEQYKLKHIGFTWAEGLSQPKLEQALDAGNGGYPSMAAVNAKKKMFIPYMGTFSADEVKTFMKAATTGKARPAKFAMPSIDEVAAWDGKDAEAPKEEL